MRPPSHSDQRYDATIALLARLAATVSSSTICLAIALCETDPHVPGATLGRNYRDGFPGERGSPLRDAE